MLLVGIVTDDRGPTAEPKQAYTSRIISDFIRCLFGRNALRLKASCCERNKHIGGNNERT